MDQWNSTLISAFDSVHAQMNHKESAKAFVRAEREKRSKIRIQGSCRWAAALACMILIFFGGYFCRMYMEPVTVISIDINPSIELGINTFDHVVRVDAYNADGRELVNELQLRFLNYQDAVKRVVTSEKVTSLLHQEEELVIAIVGEDEDRNAKLCESLETQTRLDASCYTALPQSVEHAHSCGMSYGKYLAYQQALQQDETLTAEAVQDMTMQEIREIAEEPCLSEDPPEESQEQHYGHNGNGHRKGHHH